MTYVGFVVKKHFWPNIAVLMLFLWAVSATVIALKLENKTVLIGIDSNGTRIIQRDDDPLLRSEVVNFIRHFSTTLYNFDAETFHENVGSASDLMSKELWEKEKPKVLNLSERVKSEDIRHKAVIQSIARTHSGYLVKLEAQEKFRASERKRHLSVSLQLQSGLPRTLQNPYGIEVIGIEESIYE